MSMAGAGALFITCEVPVGLPDNSFVIRDIGGAEGRKSVTNDAEEVTAQLLRIARQMGDAVSPNQPPMYYYDSDGSLAQLEHDGTRFIGFQNVRGRQP